MKEIETILTDPAQALNWAAHQMASREEAGAFSGLIKRIGSGAFRDHEVRGIALPDNDFLMRTGDDSRVISSLSSSGTATSTSAGGLRHPLTHYPHFSQGFVISTVGMTPQLLDDPNAPVVEGGSRLVRPFARAITNLAGGHYDYDRVIHDLDHNIRGWPWQEQHEGWEEQARRGASWFGLEEIKPTTSSVGETLDGGGNVLDLTNRFAIMVDERNNANAIFGGAIHLGHPLEFAGGLGEVLGKKTLLFATPQPNGQLEDHTEWLQTGIEMGYGQPAVYQ